MGEAWEVIAPSDPVDEAALRALTVEALTAALDDAPPAPPEAQLVQAVIETRTLAVHYKRLEPRLDPRLGWRAGRMAETLTDATRHLFPETPHER